MDQAVTRHRKPRLCVRCGRGPRHGEMFICLVCFTDPALRDEMAAAANLGVDQIRYLLVSEYRWHGGWGRSL